jgi:hypothetical protein
MAEDWPQWMGPGRDNVGRESGVLDSFPPGGPKIFWRSEVAGGYSGPAVADGRVFVTDYVTSDNIKVPNFERKDFTGTERIPLGDRAQGSGTAFIVKQANRFWLFTEKGDLVIANMNRDEFQELDRAHILEPTNVAFGNRLGV